jgi:hypothetical protein
LSSPYLGLNQYNYVHTGTETLYSDKIRSSDGVEYVLENWLYVV